MRNLTPILATAVVALMLGAAAGWYFASQEESAPADTTAVTPRVNAPLDTTPLKPAESGEAPGSGTQKQLDEERARVSRLETEVSGLKEDKANLESERELLAVEIEDLKSRLEAVKQDAAASTGVSTMRVDFGRWNEVEGLREADWKSLGDTYTKMQELLKTLANDVRQGIEPDPAQTAKLTELNKVLLDHMLTFYNKLPTHAPGNGEFTHPANLVNILAGQLEAGNMPLTEQQVAELKKLGEDYDKRWDALQKGYSEDTWKLQKIVDEAELKEWLHDEMFKITTPQQKALALPPEIDGYLRLDLYSAGLMLMLVTRPVQATDPLALKPLLKTRMARHLGLEISVLDGAEYVFDDWVNSCSGVLAPKSKIESSFIRTRDVITAGKAELAALRALHDQLIRDEEVKDKIGGVSEIVLPQVLKQE